MSIWEFLNSRFGILILGFALTTALGAWLTSRFQLATWKRQSRIELYGKRYEEGTQFLDDLSRTLGARFFGLQRWLWQISAPDTNALTQIETSYYEEVTKWNQSYWVFRNKVRLLVGEEQANFFLDYGDDQRPDHPQSIHYKFRRVHEIVRMLKSGSGTPHAAQQELDRLGWACSEFLEQITTEFLRRASALELLQLPEKSRAA